MSILSKLNKLVGNIPEITESQVSACANEIKDAYLSRNLKELDRCTAKYLTLTDNYLTYKTHRINGFIDYRSENSKITSLLISALASRLYFKYASTQGFESTTPLLKLIESVVGEAPLRILSQENETTVATLPWLNVKSKYDDEARRGLIPVSSTDQETNFPILMMIVFVKLAEFDINEDLCLLKHTEYLKNFKKLIDSNSVSTLSKYQIDYLQQVSDSRAKYALLTNDEYINELGKEKDPSHIYYLMHALLTSDKESGKKKLINYITQTSNHKFLFYNTGVFPQDVLHNYTLDEVIASVIKGYGDEEYMHFTQALDLGLSIEESLVFISNKKAMDSTVLALDLPELV